MTYTREQAAKAVADAVAERDAMQSNLLDLDNSLGIRLLKGASLTGASKANWDMASVTLARLWDVYSAYSAVVDRAEALTSGRPNDRDLAQVTALLKGSSIQVTRGPAPLAKRDLADTGQDTLTIAAARNRMRTDFTLVATLSARVEETWNDTAAQLETVASDLAKADPSGDETLTAEAAAIRTELGRLRDALNCDPFASRPEGAAALRGRAATLAAKSAELARLRATVDARIAAARQAADAASAARQDALAAQQRVAAKVIVRKKVPALTDPASRLAAVASLRAAGRWTRLASELDLLERDLAAVTIQFRDTERAVATLLGKRDELRGLLDAYKAKAGRLGAIEDLASVYDEAHDLLWTAPCDLDVAEKAVFRYQREVLTRGARS
jgi:hypothetical protein